MGEEIAFKNGRISDFQGLVTLTLTLNRVYRILHTIMHHSSTPNTYQISLKSKKLWTDVQNVGTGGRTFETRFIRSTRGIKQDQTTGRPHSPMTKPGDPLTQFQLYTGDDVDRPT